MLNQVMENKNPQLRQLNEVIRNNGGDIEKAFYAVAKEQGIDADEFLNSLN